MSGTVTTFDHHDVRIVTRDDGRIAVELIDTLDNPGKLDAMFFATGQAAINIGRILTAKGQGILNREAAADPGPVVAGPAPEQPAIARRQFDPSVLEDTPFAR